MLLARHETGGASGIMATPTGRLDETGLFVLAWIVFGISVLASLSLGATGVNLLSLPRVLTGWFSGEAATAESLVLMEIRLPRTLLAIYVGSALAITGAFMQSLFRNPLADPGILGVSSGAALGAVTTIALGGTFAAPWIAVAGTYAVPLAAFLGGVAATLCLVGLSQIRGGLSTTMLLLAGVALGALADAMMGLIAYVSDDRALRDLTLWRLGSLSGASWEKIGGIFPFVIWLAVATPFLIRGLNGLLLGESEAYHLGINVQQTKYIVVLTCATAVGAAVAVAGIIGFVGIVVPHCVRLVAGPDHRIVLPVSAIFGAALVLSTDVVARLIVSPAELPLGILTALVGAPVFLWLVLRRGNTG